MAEEKLIDPYHIELPELVAEKLKQLPESPGVYIMKDSSGKIIYVGKAVVLKNRVRQYFRSQRNHSPKVRAMVSHVADFETIITGSEVEALILENNLIKKHRPHYNISLKDDKTYPYVKVTLSEDYPRVIITRRLVKDGGRYFGPYADVGAVHESLKLLKRLFPLRTCKHLEQGRPCLEYHIKRCQAPCIGHISREEYGAMVKSVVLFLEGHIDDVEKNLQTRMEAAAEQLEFEQAAVLRDQLAAVRKVAEKQNIDSPGLEGDKDILALARSNVTSVACMVILFVRGGKVTGRERFFLKGGDDETDEALFSAFLGQYYQQAVFIPREILLPAEMPADELLVLKEWLESRRNGRVAIGVPQRGTKKALVDMAAENAAKYLKDESDKLTKEAGATVGAVEELQRFLGLKQLPRRMECFDISHIQGSESVASLVAFEDGAPAKEYYRRYKLKTTEGINDDFQSMREVLTRRYGKDTIENPPDLVVVDGGLGQLNAALEIIRGAGHGNIPVIGLAKQFELVFTEGDSDPIELPRRSQAFYLLQRLRDEAHRFAITYHRNIRKKRNLVSILDHIQGIGPKRRQALWKHFGTLDKIREAGEAELAAIPGMNAAAAKSVCDFFTAVKEGLISRRNFEN